MTTAGIGLSALAWPVWTARLTLRRAVPSDGMATWQYRRLSTVCEWLTRGTMTFEDHIAWFTEPPSLAKTLVIELDGEVIGDLMVQVQDGWSQAEVTDDARGCQAELGWVMHPARAGHGYATEAVAAVLAVCFRDLRLRRVTASCFAGNTASWRLMERVGMRRESYSFGDSLHRSGAWLDSMTYALLRTEWTPDKETVR